MNMDEKEAANREIVRQLVADAIEGNCYTLPDGVTLDEFVAGIKFVRGVRTKASSKPLTRRDNCLLCSRSFLSVDAHEVCWICRASAREAHAS